MKQRRFPTLMCSLVVVLAGRGLAQEPNYDEALIPAFTLPDPLTAADGAKIQSADQWVQSRRNEVLQLFEQHVFGALPDFQVPLKTELRSSVPDALAGKARRREITIRFGTAPDAPAMDMLVYTPASATGPVPLFLGLNFNGNHTIDADPAIHITDSWVRNNNDLGIQDNRATEKNRGASASRWPVATILDRGYGVATIYYGDIDPDFDDGFQNGIHRLAGPKAVRTPTSGGSISAWAWGLSRALDVLEDDLHVDATRVAVIGHSRLGKTSLWAGATDPRFAMVISNNSGCGGAALSRRRFGESVRRINTSFPHWFCLKHRDYNENEDACPVDHHMLIALAAPRPVYVASAEGDRWADPHGEFLSLYHAGPVYRLFDKTVPETDRMPALNEPFQADVGYHIRTGEHDIKAWDWDQYLKFADRHLKPQP